MAERVRSTKTPKKTKKTEEVEEVVEETNGKTGVATLDVVDDWLSDIDDILEENDAAEFVKNYVQKGGE